MMKSVPLHYRASLLLLMLFVGSYTQQSFGASNTDEVVALVRQEHSQARKEFDAIIHKTVQALYDFAHNTADGKTLSHYIKEMKHISKQLGTIAHSFHDHAIRHAVHKLQKDFNEFIDILHANQSAGANVILIRLGLRKDLLSLIPADAQWSEELVCDAIRKRCKK